MNSPVIHSVCETLNFLLSVSLNVMHSSTWSQGHSSWLKRLRANNSIPPNLFDKGTKNVINIPYIQHSNEVSNQDLVRVDIWYSYFVMSSMRTVLIVWFLVHTFGGSFLVQIHLRNTLSTSLHETTPLVASGNRIEAIPGSSMMEVTGLWSTLATTTL